MGAEFKMNDLGEVNILLGPKLVSVCQERVIRLMQTRYAGDALRRFGMEESKPMAAAGDLELWQMDVKNAFLHGKIDCEIFLR